MPGDKPGQTRCLDGCPATNFDNRWSDFARIQGVSNPGNANLCTPLRAKLPDQAPAGNFFSLTHFPWPVQSVTIRGVSTKLKVNSGRTNPPGQPSQRKPPPNKRDRPPRWFPGKSCADTTFESKAKGVAPPACSARTNLQIDQDLHPGPRTFALDVLPALLSTYLPAQARQLISASNWLLCSSRVLRSINGDRRYWNVLTLHGSYPCHL
ncbi:hypothetical protein B0D71_10975 [Pseudomonas laurylsulfativorans]|uniref:Uncharacterized protein n=1 Tax=Pseudomonas laurylsulfativorans TaxID=1943631 RepID=A0A2S3VRD8_9PSED|nr:hypothetical protein B0D71_10975 [Pseudomonas laurylsulfativorans]